MAPTLFTSCKALPPEGAGLAWDGPALAALAPTLFTSGKALPTEEAGLAWGGPALAASAPTLVTSFAALPLALRGGAVLTWARQARSVPPRASPDSSSGQ